MKIETIRYILHKSFSLNIEIIKGWGGLFVGWGRRGIDCSTKPNYCKKHHRTVSRSKASSRPVGYFKMHVLSVHLHTWDQFHMFDKDVGLQPRVVNSHPGSSVCAVYECMESQHTWNLFYSPCDCCQLGTRKEIR